MTVVRPEVAIMIRLHDMVICCFVAGVESPAPPAPSMMINHGFSSWQLSRSDSVGTGWQRCFSHGAPEPEAGELFRSGQLDVASNLFLGVVGPSSAVFRSNRNLHNHAASGPPALAAGQAEVKSFPGASSVMPPCHRGRFHHASICG